MKKLYIIISLILLTTLSACTKNNISEDGICSRYDKDTNYCSIGYDEYFDTYISLSFYIDNSIDYLAILDDVKDILIQYNELFDKYHSYQDDYDETLRNINYINPSFTVWTHKLNTTQHKNNNFTTSITAPKWL